MSPQELKLMLEREVEAFKGIQRDMQKNLSARQQLVQQSNENEMVLEELKRLDEGANIYKLIGPALVKQDQLEAKSNVQKRLDYIKAELDRLDTQLKGLETKSKEKQTELMKLQKRQQAVAGGPSS